MRLYVTQSYCSVKTTLCGGSSTTHGASVFVKNVTNENGGGKGASSVFVGQFFPIAAALLEKKFQYNQIEQCTTHHAIVCDIAYNRRKMAMEAKGDQLIHEASQLTPSFHRACVEIR